VQDEEAEGEKVRKPNVSEGCVVAYEEPDRQSADEAEGEKRHRHKAEQNVTYRDDRGSVGGCQYDHDSSLAHCLRLDRLPFIR